VTVVRGGTLIAAQWRNKTIQEGIPCSRKPEHFSLRWPFYLWRLRRIPLRGAIAADESGFIVRPAIISLSDTTDLLRIIAR